MRSHCIAGRWYLPIGLEGAIGSISLFDADKNWPLLRFDSVPYAECRLGNQGNGYHSVFSICHFAEIRLSRTFDFLGNIQYCRLRSGNADRDANETNCLNRVRVDGRRRENLVCTALSEICVTSISFGISAAYWRYNSYRSQGRRDMS